MMNSLNAETKNFEYDLYYQGVYSGEASLSSLILNDKIYGSLKLRTAGFMDKLFTIRDTIDIVAQWPEYHLIFRDKRIHEGKYRRHRIFDIADIDTSKLSRPIRDEYSGIFMLLDSLYFGLESIDLNLLKKKKEKLFQMSLIRYETIKISGKNYSCLLYKPTDLSMKSIKRGKSHLSVWMLDSIPSKPMRMKLDFKYGTVVLNLKEPPQY